MFKSIPLNCLKYKNSVLVIRPFFSSKVITKLRMKRGEKTNNEVLKFPIKLNYFPYSFFFVSNSKTEVLVIVRKWLKVFFCPFLLLMLTD